MPRTSRKKRPITRGEVEFKDAYLIVVAVEGAKTEKWYFELFQPRRVKVVVRENVENLSSPSQVIEQLHNYKREYNLDETDQLWLVIDRDRWKADEIHQVCKECNEQGYLKAVSNPCFEYWLLFYHHEKSLSSSSTDAKKQLRKIHNDLFGKLSPLYSNIERTKAAISRAKNADPDPDAPFPQTSGTHVYKLMEQFI
ncbi:MAG: RloB family protein [Balneolales bacterium]